MRISDWSSDVCSSDLPPSGRNLVDDLPFLGLVSVKTITGEQVLLGYSHARRTDEVLYSPSARHNAPLDFGKRELGGLRGDDEVAHQSQFQSSTVGMPLDRRDDG